MCSAAGKARITLFFSFIVVIYADATQAGLDWKSSTVSTSGSLGNIKSRRPYSPTSTLSLCHA